MKKENFALNNQEAPDLDAPKEGVFRVGFMKSILLSLLEQKKLTQAQYERCMEKVRQKYTDSSNP